MEPTEIKLPDPKPCFKLSDQRTPGAVNAVRFNSSGQYSMTAGADKVVKLWNTDTGRLVKQYTGHGHELLCLDVYVYHSSR